MVKKVIQVPVGAELLGQLSRASKKQGRSRADLIREACLSYLRRLEEDELEAIYRRGYEKMPEKEDTGRVQASLIVDVLPREVW